MKKFSSTQSLIFYCCFLFLIFQKGAGPEFELIARNDMGAPSYATPAISGSTLFVRTMDGLLAITSKSGT